MSLTNAYLVTTKNLEKFLNAIKSARAPERLSSKFLEQLEFASSNDRLFVGLLKGLGFVDESGVPTQRYYSFLDQTESGRVLADAVREAYEDLFAINTKANELSVDDVKNKLKTLTQGQKSDKVIGLMASTFRALCDLADWEARPAAAAEQPPSSSPAEPPLVESLAADSGHSRAMPRHPQLHYNIQIHLPASRDPAVFDAIFQSLRRHLL